MNDSIETGVNRSAASETVSSINNEDLPSPDNEDLPSPNNEDLPSPDNEGLPSPSTSLPRPEEESLPPLLSDRTKNVLLVILPALLLAVIFYNALAGNLPRPGAEDQTDRTPPSIMLTRDNRYFVRPGEQYEEEGYSAFDNLDGDLTDQVEVSVGEDMVRYRVSDSAGNTTIRFRRIPYADESEDPAQESPLQE